MYTQELKHNIEKIYNSKVKLKTDDNYNKYCIIGQWVLLSFSYCCVLPSDDVNLVHKKPQGIINFILGLYNMFKLKDNYYY